jgi:hypothetical protein
MRTLLLPARLAFLPVRLLLFPFRRGGDEATMDDLADAIDELAEFDDALDELDAEEVVEAVVEELSGRSRRSKAARGLFVLVILGVTVAVVLYLLRQRRDYEYARLVPEPEQPDLTPTDPVTPAGSTDDPGADDDGDVPSYGPSGEVAEEVEERTPEPVIG